VSAGEHFGVDGKRCCASLSLQPEGRARVAHKFEIYKDKAGEFRVRFKYNSEIIFSTEGYSDKSGAKRAVESIRKHVGDAEIVELE
jgi:uncharacterized protein